MKRFLAIFVILAGANAALAQTPLLPALFDVSGVQGDDVLNVREGPATSFAVIATLKPAQTGIEVVALSDDSKWGLVGLTERSGWVSLRFMAQQPGGDDYSLPRPLSCFGTEPFWNLNLSEETNIFDRLDGTAQHLTLDWQGSPGNRPPNTFGLHLTESNADIHAVITRTQCNDGMSDREFGLRIQAILSGSIGPEILTGCCSISQR